MEKRKLENTKTKPGRKFVHARNFVQNVANIMLGFPVFPLGHFVAILNRR